MSEYEPEIGGRVLVDGIVADDPAGEYKVEIAGNAEHPRWMKRRFVHPHPGVDVAALVEECERAATLVDSYREEDLGGEYMTTPYNDLRAAREATKKPKEGWIKVTIGNGTREQDDAVAVTVQGWDGGIRRDVEDIQIFVHPSDIQTDPPQGGE